MEIFIKITEIFLLGLIGGAVPGPMLTAVFTEVLRGGFKKSVVVTLRALGAEAAVALVILLIVFSFTIPPLYFYVVSIFGAGFLIYLATQVWLIEKIDSGEGEIFTFVKILILTVLSGAFWIFWLTICLPRAFALRELVAGGQYLFLISFEAGWLLMTVFLAYIFSRFRPLLLKKNLVGAVFKVFALLLVFFALKSVYSSLIFFLK